MNPVPSPSRIDVIIHTGDTEWRQIVAGLGPLVVLLVAAWWSRARWALEATLDDDPVRREVGFAALDRLATSNLTGTEETRFIAEAWKSALHGRDRTGALSET
ncbi:hypothetical protein [Arthrobacter sp. NPDC093139]|uniref:hypothetical protein n=1 Tax=Arthrobacter sp. NPDC093139 TaxID=3363945 RepID=UPI00382AA20C